MGILGEPDTELVDILGEIEEIQQTARRPIRAGAMGREIYERRDHWSSCPLTAVI